MGILGVMFTYNLIVGVISPGWRTDINRDSC